MSEADRLKWDERYRAGAYADRGYPTSLLADRTPQLARGRALDVACGAGRNSLYLAAHGWQVEAVDISPVGLLRAQQNATAKGLTVRWIQADLENDAAAALPAGPYDLIVMVRYVNPALYSHLVERLACGGVLICEQHVESTEDVIGPKNPAYRLRHSELLRAFTRTAEPDHRVLYYREGVVTDPDGRNAALAQLVLRRECGGGFRRGSVSMLAVHIGSGIQLACSNVSCACSTLLRSMRSMQCLLKNSMQLSLVPESPGAGPRRNLPRRA